MMGWYGMLCVGGVKKRPIQLESGIYYLSPTVWEPWQKEKKSVTTFIKHLLFSALKI